MAISNVDGVTPNHLLQQMYGMHILDEDVDLELSDEELELVAGQGGDVASSPSDVFYNGNLIIDIDDFLRSDSNPHRQLDFICNRLPAEINRECCLDQQIPCPNGRNDRNTAEVIRQQLLAPAVKQQYPNGFNISLETGQVTPR